MTHYFSRGENTKSAPRDFSSLLNATAALLAIVSTSLVYSSSLNDTFVDSETDDENSYLVMQDNSSMSNQDQNTTTQTGPFALPKTRWRTLYTGEFLCWKAEQQGLEIGLQSPNFTDNPPLPDGSASKGVFGSIANLKANYHPGYRLNFTFEHPHDEWLIGVTWTHYHNRQHRSVHVKEGKDFFPDWLDGNFFPFARGAKASWKLSFSSLELNLGRSFYAGRCFSLKPFAGFKAAWINQTFNIDYLQVALSGPSTLTSEAIKVHDYNNMQGYGIDGGLLTHWDLGAGFYLFGTASGALLWSKYTVGQFSKEVEGTPRSREKDPVHEVIPQFSLMGGVAWEKQFYRDRLYVNIHAGWEEQVWFDLNQFNRYVDTDNQGKTVKSLGNLSLYGLTLGASVGF